MGERERETEKSNRISAEINYRGHHTCSGEHPTLIVDQTELVL